MNGDFVLIKSPLLWFDNYRNIYLIQTKTLPHKKIKTLFPSLRKRVYEKPVQTQVYPNVKSIPRRTELSTRKIGLYTYIYKTRIDNISSKFFYSGAAVRALLQIFFHD